MEGRREVMAYLGRLEQGEAEGAEGLLEEGVRLSHAHVLSSGRRPSGINDQAGEGEREGE